MKERMHGNRIIVLRVIRRTVATFEGVDKNKR